jgi:MYXO-CTERM domain-containing protein
MSLWQVDDEATRDLMTKFYQNMFQKGLGRSEAMRKAQLSLLAQPGRQHPFYWASFIVSGDWTPLSGIAADASSANGKTITVPRGGAKGCGCRMVADDNQNRSASLVAAVMVIAVRRRRRPRRVY